MRLLFGLAATFFSLAYTQAAPSLFGAIADNDNVEMVKQALAAGADVNEVHDGDSALEWAVQNLALKSGALLLEKGAKVDPVNQHGRTPLEEALHYGSLEFATLLLDHGAALHRPGSAALFSALPPFYGYPQDYVAVSLRLLKLLISHGADINEHDSVGYTLLMYAAIKQEPNLVDGLLALGADINAADPKGSTALYLTALDYNPEALPMLQFLVLHGANLEARGEFGDTPLLAAIWRGNNPGFEFLLAHGANERAVSPRGGALMFALAGNYELAKRFISENLEINDAYNGESPLIFALRSDGMPEEIPVLLLQHGADPNAVDSEGATAILYAKTSMVKLLVDRGVNVNVHNADGDTPLMKAIYLVNAVDHDHVLERIDALVAHGADVSAINKHGYYPFSIVGGGTRGGNDELSYQAVVHLLPGRPDLNQINPVTDRPFILDVAYNHDLRLLRLYATLGAKLDVRGDNEESLLHYAAMDDDLGEASTLLEFHVDVNARDYDKKTPLAFAHSDAMKTLIKKNGGTL